jgi:hypothetical protein
VVQQETSENTGNENINDVKDLGTLKMAFKYDN